jgi:hypothetical protein
MSRDGPLFTEPARLLGPGWSPEQISGSRRREDAGTQREPGLRVSHEAIYALPRGELRREPIGCLRRAKPARGRKPKGSELRGKLVAMTNIKDRPEEIEGRPVPGHCEGDLILGAKGASAIGTLVERTTRFVVLVRMPARKADVAASAFAGACGLPSIRISSPNRGRRSRSWNTRLARRFFGRHRPSSIWSRRTVSIDILIRSSSASFSAASVAPKSAYPDPQPLRCLPLRQATLNRVAHHKRTLPLLAAHRNYPACHPSPAPERASKGAF